MLLSLVPAHKPHGCMTLRQLQTPHEPRGEHQMLVLFHWCGKCQLCRWWKVFYFLGSGCDLSPWCGAQHLIHKHSGRRWVLCSACQTADEMPSYCTVLFIIHLRKHSLFWSHTDEENNKKWKMNPSLQKKNALHLTAHHVNAFFIAQNRFPPFLISFTFVSSWGKKTPGVEIFKDVSQHTFSLLFLAALCSHTG